ncbi:zinc finger protein Xfin-like [Saccostrea echinata]|uniref:zinc finger protein Xfin-like n=1 Tax=Saccostrea echinata TaxID=191078 RepID=UPI002A8387DB|nr:zinc finger protein Xfin-like [Saccostrea echinata]
MDDTGNSSVLDTSEGALVVDLSHCTDDSQLSDTSRCRADNSRLLDTLGDKTEDSRMSDPLKIIPESSQILERSNRADTQQSEISVCVKSKSEGTMNVTDSNQSEVVNREKTEGEEVNEMCERGLRKREVDVTQFSHQPDQTDKFTPKKNIRPMSLGGKNDINKSKYTPQKVDHRLAQLAVNAYVSPSCRGNDLKKENADDNTVSNAKINRNDKSLKQLGLPVNGTTFVSKENSKPLQPSSICNVESTVLKATEEKAPSLSENRCVQREDAGSSQNSFSKREEQSFVAENRQMKPIPADFYSQEMSRLNSKLQQREKSPRVEWNVCPEGDDEEIEDMNETCDQSDLSKMEDEMDTSQVQEGEPVQPLMTTDVHCAMCNNWFMNMNSYTMHMAKHAQMSSPLLGLKCKICEKMYLYEMEFKAHVQAHLEMPKVYKCRVCFKSFEEKSELQRHVKIHQDKKEFSCQFCGKEFHYSFNLKKHLRTHTGEKPYTCVLCELKFTHKNSLNRHMSLHTNETELECSVCNKVCLDRWTLQKHLASHQLLSCNQCDQSFTNSKELQKHQKTHKETTKENSAPDVLNSQTKEQLSHTDSAQNNPGNIEMETVIKPNPDQKSRAKRTRRSMETQCEVCRKAFKNPGNYYRHLQSKEGMPIQTCDLCGLKFHDVYDLLKHTRQVHSQTSDTKGYICRVCGQSFPDLTLLTEHMSEHLQTMKKSGNTMSETKISKTEGSGSLFCSICGEKFYNPVMLDLHMMEHSSSQSSSENALDLSKSRKDATQPPPRKRLKLEAIQTEEPHEYYDSDKENEPLNLSKKKYSPRVKAKVLGIHQERIQSTVPCISTMPLVNSAMPIHHNSQPQTSPGSVGLDLSCRSKRSETSHGTVVVDQTLSKDQEMSELNKCTEKDFTKTVKKEELGSLDSEEGVTPLKSPNLDSNIAMETSQEDFPDENSSLTDKSDFPDHASDLSSRADSPSLTLTCEYCSKVFTDPVTMNRHLSSHYKEWAFCCNYCNTMFTEEDSYRAHTPVHPPHNPYMCNVCHNHFPDRISLGAHQSQVHPQEKPFQCGVCQRRFPVKSYLGSHCRTHLTERPFKCNVCDRTFVHNFNLTKHMRTHTGEKPYTCAWCDRKFSQKNSLNRHEKIHMRETPSKGTLPTASGGGQLFSPGPDQEDTSHGRTTPYKSDRSTPPSLIGSNTITPQSQHKTGSGQNRSRNSSAGSTGMHQTTPDLPPQDRYPNLPPDVLQHIYLQQMAMMQHMAQQQQHGHSMNLMQNSYMMAAYMQQMHMMQQMASRDPKMSPYPPGRDPNMLPYQPGRDPNMSPYTPTSMESMSSYSKSIENYGNENTQQQLKSTDHSAQADNKGT